MCAYRSHRAIRTRPLVGSWRRIQLILAILSLNRPPALCCLAVQELAADTEPTPLPFTAKHEYAHFCIRQAPGYVHMPSSALAGCNVSGGTIEYRGYEHHLRVRWSSQMRAYKTYVESTQSKNGDNQRDDLSPVHVSTCHCDLSDHWMDSISIGPC